MGETLEAVLLVEPFAMVSALEDYIWDKHGPKTSASAAAASTPTSRARACSSTSPGALTCSTDTAGSALAGAAAAAAGADPAAAAAAAALAPATAEAICSLALGGGEGRADGTEAAGGGATSSSAGGVFSSPAPPPAQSPPETPAARVRLSMKQPPVGLLRTTSGDMSPASTPGEQPPTPLVDPNTPSGRAPFPASFPPPGAAADRGGSPQGRGTDPTGGPGGAGTSARIPNETTANAGACRVGEVKRQRRVRIYLNGNLLPSRISIVQSLVNHAHRVPVRCSASSIAISPPFTTASEDRGARGERFMALAEDLSGSDGDGEGTGGSGGGPLAGAVWGRVHSMSYELITEDSPRSAHDAGPDCGTVPVESGSAGSRISQTHSTAVFSSEFDALVQKHAQVPKSLASLTRPSAAAGEGSGASGSSPPSAAPAFPARATAAAAASAAAGAAVAPSAAAASVCPEASAAQEALEDASGDAASSASGVEELSTMLQLISALHNVSEYLRLSQGVEVAAAAGLDQETFHCASLTGLLLRQLSDPLAVCTGSVPAWCIDLAGACCFLFPYSVRRIVHHSCNLGLARALQHVQQRALAQFAHSPEVQRRLEGEVAVASIPRQKVRISRQRILESAVKVMNLYGGGTAILEVEYVGEVGTGSGPTLEFYAQVSDILRISEPQLFRQEVPNGMLFPAPRDPACFCKAGDQAAQQIMERFRLLGQVVAKCILDGRLVDMQFHPLFWRGVLGRAPFTQQSLREVDPALFASLQRLRGMDDEALGSLCVSFTLPGHPDIELIPGGADVTLSKSNLEDYIGRVAEVSLVTSVVPQMQAFRSAFAELLPLGACAVWSERELASIIVGASVRDDACWTLEHLGAHIKAQHGYNTESRCFQDLLAVMAEFSTEDRRRFLTFATGAPSLPIGGFGGLKPPLTVVKKEAPPAPLTPDQFMPSVMTCANYLKLPEYTKAELLKQKLLLAMLEGQSAFLLS